MTDRDAFTSAEGGALAALRALVQECCGRRWTLPCPRARVSRRVILAMRRSVESSPPRAQSARPAGYAVCAAVGDFGVRPAGGRAASGGADLGWFLRRSVPRDRGAQERLDAAAARLAGPLPPAPQLDTPDDVTFAPVLKPGQYHAIWCLPVQDYRCGRYISGKLAQRFTAPRFRCRRWRCIARYGVSTLAVPLLPRYARLCVDRLQPGNSGAGARCMLVTIRPIAGTRPREKTATEER